MPRKAAPPKLQLYGPDTKHGAKRVKNFREYYWYVKWRENGVERKEACDGATLHETEKANAYFSQWLSEQKIGQANIDTITISQILETYIQEHGPVTNAVDAIELAISHLKRYWDTGIGGVNETACKGYVTFRADEGVKPATAGKELRVLSAAINHCHRKEYIKARPFVWSPTVPKGAKGAKEAEKWLSRSDAARLIREARRNKKAPHLVLFILIALYTGQRTEAVLRLQWFRNPWGGHIDLNGGKIYWQKEIDEAKQQSNKKQPYATPIPPRLLRFLKNAKRITNGHYVINYNGTRIKRIIKGFQATAIKAGFKAPNDSVKSGWVSTISPHILSHTSITWMLQKGLATGKVSEAVGKTEDMIKNVYGHHCPEHMDEYLKVWA